MKKGTLRVDSIYAFLSIISLLYIFYYTTIFYYKEQNIISDFVYEYLAVPIFWFSVSAFVVTVFCTFIGFQGFSKVQSKKNQGFSLLIIVFIGFIILKKLDIVFSAPIFFSSVYCIVYFLVGFFIALAFYKNK